MTTARRLRAVPSTPRFGIAVRVSRVQGRSGERFHSPETQEAGARRAVAAVGGVVDEAVGQDGVFFDFDVSGGTAPSSRPGLGAALELVRDGRLDGIAVFDLSRWSRETVSGLRELEDIAALGGQVITGSETIDLKTPGGKFATTVQLAAQQMRREEAAKAWRETHESRFARGLPHGKLPIGYTSDGQGGAAVHDDVGPAVREAFRALAIGSASQQQIADRLSAARGRTVRQGVVSQMIRNRFYLGEVTYNGETKTGRHEPLVDERTWRELQARLGSHHRGGAGSGVLAGLALCGADGCGRHLHVRDIGRSPSGERRIYLRCAGVRDETCDGIGTPRYDELERAAVDHCLELAVSARDRRPELSTRDSAFARAQARLVELDTELERLEQARGRLGALVATEVMTEADYRATRDDLVRQQQPLEQERDALRLRLDRRPPTPGELASAAERMGSWWGSRPDGTPYLLVHEKQRLLRVFLTSVTVGRPQYRGQAVTERVRFLAAWEREDSWGA